MRKTEEISRRILERNGLKPDDLDLFTGEVVPALRAAGAFRQAYSGKTLRDHLGLGQAVNQYAEV